MPEDDDMTRSQSAGMIEDHFRDRNPMASLMANVMLILRDARRQQLMPKSLEQMTTREIIAFVETMFPR